MQSDIDAQLSNFFEDTPPREFDVVLRGYDRHQVDEHIKSLDNEVRQTREQTQALQRELSDAHRQLQEQERPTYSGLGARIEQLLRLAEEQATELVQAARSEANEIKAAAKVDAAEQRANAESDAAEL
ncbi:MAG: DivIVA domain-containing protein, partial [Spirillospora sp.]